MINVECLVSPVYFKLVNGVVYIYGGVFRIDGETIDFDDVEDKVFKFLDLNEYNCNYTDYPNVLCSRNLYIKKGESI